MVLTPSNEAVHQPPFLIMCPEHPHQQHIHHHTLTQHPAEGGEEEVVQEHSNNGAGHLVEGGGGRRDIMGMRKERDVSQRRNCARLFCVWISTCLRPASLPYSSDKDNQTAEECSAEVQMDKVD